MKGTIVGGTKAVAAFVVRYVPATPMLDRFTVETARQVLFSGVSVAGPLVVTLLVVFVTVRPRTWKGELLEEDAESWDRHREV